MAYSSREDSKYLDEQQASLVGTTRHPGLREVDNEHLGALERDIREHRDTARTRAGASEGGGFEGRRREQILTQAVKRVSRERDRRDRHLARSDLRQFASDVTGTTMNKKGSKRGSAKGFADAAERHESGEEAPGTT